MCGPAFAIITTIMRRTMNGDPNEQVASNAHDETQKDRARQLGTLAGLSDKFGDSLAHAFTKSVSEGKKFDDVLKSIQRSLVDKGLRLALSPLQSALSQSVKNVGTGG